MDKSTRNNIQRATQRARKLLEDAYREQLEGTFDILLDGTVAPHPGTHLSAAQRLTREKLVATIAHKRASGLKAMEAVDAYLREAAFTTLNRFVALKMLEARDLVQECVSKGEDSSGFKEFTALAPGLVALEDRGYRLYIESLFDEIACEVRVLFDLRDVASLLWPDRQVLLELVDILNDPRLALVWAEDETIGWVYQYFNGEDERRAMRDASQVPRNGRELAVRNQFFTPRYVVQFLTDNTLGHIWHDMRRGDTRLRDLEYRLRGSRAQVDAETVPNRPRRDPRDIRVLDPACGSGHFLLYAFDLFMVIYEEAWADAEAPSSEATGLALTEEYEDLELLRSAIPGLILRHNLHGVDIDPRAAQIAALALWLRAQRAYKQLNIERAQRPPVTKTNIVVAEPMPGDAKLRDDLVATLTPELGRLVERVFAQMVLAGEAGTLLRIEGDIHAAVREVYQSSPGTLLKALDEQAWVDAEARLISALRDFGTTASDASELGRRLFTNDATQGLGFIDVCRQRYDVVLMNPPFGPFAAGTKEWAKTAWPRTKNDIYAAFVERGIGLLRPQGRLGAITSRTGFFLKSFQKWREDILLTEAPPVVVADLGYGVMDDAMVEAAAYCLEVPR